MEIRKSPISSQYLASLMMQREIASASSKVDGISGRIGLSAEGPERESPSRQFDPREVRSALQALDEEKASEDRPRMDASKINNRARQALAAYQTQERLASEDARVTLSQMLGVDFYA